MFDEKAGCDKLAAVTALLLRCRVSEVPHLRVQDLDCRGTRLGWQRWTASMGGKTHNAARNPEVPRGSLRPRFAAAEPPASDAGGVSSGLSPMAVLKRQLSHACRCDGYAMAAECRWYVPTACAGCGRPLGCDRCSVARSGGSAGARFIQVTASTTCNREPLRGAAKRRGWWKMPRSAGAPDEARTSRFGSGAAVIVAACKDLSAAWIELAAVIGRHAGAVGSLVLPPPHPRC